MVKINLTYLKKQLAQRNKHLIIPIVVICILVAFYVYQVSKSAFHQQSSSPASVKEDTLTKAMTPPPLSNRQKQQLEEGKSTATNEKMFYITMGNYYFTPNKITVNEGDRVAIVFTNNLGSHDFVIDGLSVRSQIILPGQITVINFTADKKGTYTFYSSLTRDKQHGMKGTLVVQ